PKPPFFLFFFVDFFNLHFNNLALRGLVPFSGPAFRKDFAKIKLKAVHWLFNVFYRVLASMGLRIKLFQTFSKPILTPVRSTAGISLRIDSNAVLKAVSYETFSLTTPGTTRTVSPPNSLVSSNDLVIELIINSLPEGSGSESGLDQ